MTEINADIPSLLITEWKYNEKPKDFGMEHLLKSTHFSPVCNGGYVAFLIRC